MKSGKCPKCNSDKVYSGMKVFPKSGPFGSNSIPVSLTSIAALDNYVCVDCGYVESYVEADKLEEIAKKWQKADETPAPSEDKPT